MSKRGHTAIACEHLHSTSISMSNDKKYTVCHRCRHAYDADDFEGDDCRNCSSGCRGFVCLACVEKGQYLCETCINEGVDDAKFDSEHEESDQDGS